MSRRSSRLQTKTAVKEDTASSSPTPPPTKPRARPAPKKQKGSSERKDVQSAETAPGATKPPAIWAKVRGRRGHLKLVVEMPFDILLEIFHYLTPVDLLNLSKANHAFRDLLLDRSTAFQLWKEAFSRMDPQPPTCPDDMSLPQYANLLYGRTCFFCDSIHSLTRSWVAYIRFCKHCLGGPNFIAVAGAGKGSVEYNLNRMVTYFNHADTRQSRALRSEYEKHRARLNELKDDQQGHDKYVNEQTSKLRARQNNTGGFNAWEYSIIRNKNQDIIQRRGTRKEAILEKLEVLGYKKVLDRMGSWQVAKLPGLTGVKPLTDREWEKVRPAIVGALDAQQAEYDRHARVVLVNKRTPPLGTILNYYWSHHRDMELYGPRLSQVARLEPFRSIIYDTPEEEQIQTSDLMKRLSDMTPALDAWRERAEAILIGLIPISSTPPVAGSKKAKGKAKEVVRDASVLKLATSIFNCKWCGSLLLYPHVLVHGCMYRRQRPYEQKGWVGSSRRGGRNRRNDPAFQVIYYSEEDKSDPNVAWNEGGEQIQFHEEASKYAAAIAKSLGEDPATVTWKELDSANQRVECLRCKKPKASAHRRLAMDWRQAIVHQLNSENFKELKDHSGSQNSFTHETVWKKIDEASLEKVLKRENAVEPPGIEGNPPRRCGVRLACLECGKQTLSPTGVLEKVGRLTIVGPGDTRCSPAGHDLSNGAYIDQEYSDSFTTPPYPIRIP